MDCTLLLLGVLLLPCTEGQAPSGRPAIRSPIALEVGTGATRRGGLLELLFSMGDDATGASERGLGDGLRERPWLQIVPADGEAAVLVTHSHRTISSERRGRDRNVSRTFKYTVRAAVAIRGERGELEAERLVTRSGEVGSERLLPSRHDDRTAFREAGDALAREACDWLLARMPALRPDGPDAGFQHKVRTKWLVRGDGLEVTAVGPGTPAERAGLQVGDRIRRVDAEAGTREMDERVRSWRLEEAGTRVSLEVERGGRRVPLAVELAAPRTSRASRHD